MDIKSTILTRPYCRMGLNHIFVRISTFVTPHLSSSHNPFKIVTATLPQFVTIIIIGLHNGV